MGEEIPAATSSCLAWMGRTRALDGSVTLGFPGVMLSANFRGTMLAIEWEANSPECYFDVSVDGSQWRTVRAEKGRSRLVLAEGLISTQHHLRMIRRTESWQGVVTAHRIATDGTLVAPPPLPWRRLLFVGDSITCGAGADRLPPEYPEGHITSNANASFGMELGRRVNAQVHLVSYGGRGLVRDWQGLTNDKINNAPVFFERTLPDDPSACWDHGSWQPDVVVVTLGTNDFNQGIPDEQVWVAAYEVFAARIREVHPQAWIFLMNGPIFGPRVDNGDAAKAAAINHYLDETVYRRLSAGDRRIEKALFRYQPGSPKDAHPIAPQHLLMADDLEPVLRSRLGWR